MEAAKRNQRVFVYGTLKKGQYFHPKYLEDKSNYLGKATAGLDYTMYVDGLPHLVKEPTDEGVKGELYEVDESVLKSLDELEGHPSVYFREIIDVYDESGGRVLAWAYLRHKNFKGKSNAWRETEFL